MPGHIRSRKADERQAAVPEWSRRKMLALLGGGVAVCAVLLVGLVLTVVSAIGSAQPAQVRRTTGHGVVGGAVSAGGAGDLMSSREALAARPMRTVPAAASHPGPVSTADPGTITLPAPTRSGPAGVPTGYPHNPAGALAQLAAIDQVAMQSGTLAGARAVITGWAMPGGPTASSWSLVHGLSVLFTQLGLSGGGSGRLAIVLTPLMGQIKGTVGPDFVVPCVDFELDVTFAQTARGAVADCQRMVWNPSRAGSDSGRWMIGFGSEPATPPSVWPDTQAAIAVGYHDLRFGPRS